MLEYSCPGPGFFVRGGGGGGGGGGVGGGGPGKSNKKKISRFFSVLSLFYRSQVVNFKEIYHFSRFQRGSKILQGGPNFSRGEGSNYLFPIETHITCDFPGGPGPCPPLWIRTWVLNSRPRDSSLSRTGTTAFSELCPWAKHITLCLILV